MVIQCTEMSIAEVASTSTSLAEMLRGYSVELNPRRPRVVEEALDRLDRGTEVFLPWIPGSDPMDLVAPAARLRRAGFCPRPHVAARHIESAAQLEEFVARLAGEAEVDRILLIAGDRHQPAGPYDSSLAVMETGVFQKAGIIRMAVGGFPEGNPHIADVALEQALVGKINFAPHFGLELSIVTQFCFTAGPIVEWLRGVRARGIDIPVRVGLAGPASLITLARYAVRCGIGNSLRMLTENPRFAKLLMDKGPEPIIHGIAGLIGKGGASLGIAGLTFMSLADLTKPWTGLMLCEIHNCLRLTLERCANLWHKFPVLPWSKVQG